MMKVKIITTPYISWRGVEGKVIRAFRTSDSQVYASIEDANKYGADDYPTGGITYAGYRLLSPHEFVVLSEGAKNEKIPEPLPSC